MFKLKNWFDRRIRWSHREILQPQSERIIFNERPITLNIYSANGGWVVQYSQYNEETDTTSSSLNVINYEQDLGENLVKIINFEMLKK